VLNCRTTTLYRNFARLNDPADFDRLRSLSAYRDQVHRLQADAEACAVRLMIRNGKPLMALAGDDLLAYADLVRASGRTRREHLIWELVAELGPLADEPPTLRAAWTARGNSRQHSTAALVDRYGIPVGPVRDLLVDYLGELRPALDYSSLEGRAYILARLFWRTVLEVSPAQATLRLDRDTVTAGGNGSGGHLGRAAPHRRLQRAVHHPVLLPGPCSSGRWKIRAGGPCGRRADLAALVWGAAVELGPQQYCERIQAPPVIGRLGAEG
jgi:hypothetical protein